MAATSVTTDLTTVAAADINNTDGGGAETWAQSTDGNFNDGGTPSDEPDFYIQGTTCVSANHTKNGVNTNTLLYDAGATQTLPTDGAYLIWCYWASPPSLNTYAAATPGLLTAVGTGLGALDFYAASGSDFTPNPLGGWYCYAIDPSSHTADVTAATSGGGGDGQVLGMAVTASRQARGQSFAVDAIRTGRGSSIVTGGTAPDAAAEFVDISDALDTFTNRYGIFQAVPGGFSWQGRLALGDGTNEVRFVDSNKNITILNTPKVSTGYHQIEIQNGTSVASIVDWENITFVNAGVGDPIAPTNSRGNFVATDNANITMDGCSFTNMGTFVFNESGANPNTLTDVTFRSCEQVTQANATMTGCTFETSVDTVSLLTSSTTLTEFNKVTSSFFIKPTTDNHAVSFGTVNPGSPVIVSFDGHSLEGYTAGSLGTFTGTAADNNAAISMTNNGANVTIDVINNADLPSVENTGTGNVIVRQQVLNTIDISDADGAISSALVIIINTSTNTELTSGLTNGSGIFTFNSGANIPIAVRVRKSTTGATRYVPVETTNNTGATGTSVFITLTEDLIASA